MQPPSSPEHLPHSSRSATPLIAPHLEQFPIEHWNLLRLELLWAFDGPLMASAYNHRYFSHPTAAWLIRRGSLTLRFPSGEEHYSEGQWVFPQQMSGRQIFSEGAELISLRFYAEWRSGQPLFPRARSIAFQEADAPLLRQTAEPLARYVQENLSTYEKQTILPYANVGNFMMLQPLFINWISAYYQTFVAHGQTPEVIPPLGDAVRSAIAYLQARPLHQPFHEKELAGHVGLSVSQLNRLFSRQAKVTPHEFWNYRRLETAQTLLLSGKDRVKSIAYHLGFASPETFTRWFHRSTGYSPSQFRFILR